MIRRPALAAGLALAILAQGGLTAHAANSSNTPAAAVHGQNGAHAPPAKPQPSDPPPTAALAPGPSPGETQAVTPNAVSAPATDPAPAAAPSPAAPPPPSLMEQLLSAPVIISVAAIVLILLNMAITAVLMSGMGRQLDGMQRKLELLDHIQARVDTLEGRLEKAKAEFQAAPLTLNTPVRSPPRPAQSPPAAAQAEPRLAPSARSPDRDPFPARPPVQSRAASIEEIIRDFNLAVSAGRLEAISEFADLYGPQSLELSDDGHLVAAPGDALWYIPIDRLASESSSQGLLIPGRDTIKNWEKFIAKGFGETGRRKFGELYDLEEGGALRLVEPAIVEQTTRGFRSIKKGRLQGI